jgi:hypothetical protein
MVNNVIIQMNVIMDIVVLNISIPSMNNTNNNV